MGKFNLCTYSIYCVLVDDPLRVVLTLFFALMCFLRLSLRHPPPSGAVRQYQLLLRPTVLTALQYFQLLVILLLRFFFLVAHTKLHPCDPFDSLLEGITAIGL
jgi:hypothetical protein